MIHTERVGAVAAGVVTDTYGTDVNKTLDAIAGKLLAIQVITAVRTPTAAQGHAIKIRITAPSLGFANEEFIMGAVTTSSPATNEGGYPGASDIIPLNTPIPNASCSGAQVTVAAAPLGASTVAEKVEVNLIYNGKNDPQPPKEFLEWLTMFGSHRVVRGGKATSAQVLTTTPTTLGDLTIPNWASELVGYKLLCMKTGAITASEEVLGKVDLTGLGGLAPNELQATWSTGGSIGTPVENNNNAASTRYFPLHIPLPGIQLTLTPTFTLRTAVTTDDRIAFGLVYR